MNPVPHRRFVRRALDVKQTYALRCAGAYHTYYTALEGLYTTWNPDDPASTQTYCEGLVRLREDLNEALRNAEIARTQAHEEVVMEHYASLRGEESP